MYYVYVLFNTVTGKRYIGQTDNLAKRLARHNDSTRKRTYTQRQPGQWELRYHETCATRSEAMGREKWLKSGQGREWLAEKLRCMVREWGTDK